MAHRLLAKGGVDVEALSPRDANAQRMPKATDLKTKAAGQLKTAKENPHPPAPPLHVPEPPSADRPDGAVYETEKQLGKGGFAVCWQGSLVNTRKKYALKIVKSQMAPKMEQKFRTELQIHSKMNQKNIVEFFRASRRGLTEPEVRYYSVQIAGAIKYMHGKGIIHRDLKMGNIFLDMKMNAKIGDFGLAALLVTGRDMHTIRRTTLCGTLNYMAPEILEKGKKGHDHMVDIWSLGIIMFAMLTSKPPFQSRTPDEIYRRVRERDYEWPTANKSISQEAKDVVATMLTDADMRPDPDSIVQHPFFVSGYMPVPADMYNTKLREADPTAPQFWFEHTPERQALATRNLREMCRDCGVGPWAPVQVIHTQIWKEFAAEEKSGFTPLIPLAENIVYRPFDQWLREQQEQHLQQHQQRPLARSHEQAYRSQAEAVVPAQKEPSGLLRAPPQSFAAQQRAQNRPATTIGSLKPRSLLEPISTSQSLRARSRRELPATESRAKEATDSYKPQRASSSTSERVPLTFEQPVAPKALVVPAEKAVSTSSSTNQSAAKEKNKVMKNATLFGPQERPFEIPASKPDAIFERLQRLQAELERALNARTMAIISTKDVTPPLPFVVVKWVDYTHKFGLGYILNDGSIGCALRDIPTTEGSQTTLLPPACMIVRGAERHIQRRQDESYPDRHHPVPLSESVHFFENHGERGLCQVSIPAQQFKVPTLPDGSVGKLKAGKDLYEHRKRERVILWKKFADYMIAHGRDDAVPAEETNLDIPTTKTPTSAQPGDVVTFYQRFGDVGCWVFCDGHLQFNFPDHTKVVIDATGRWCHFWHLPQEAAEKLATTGSMCEAALDERAMLSYPLQTLLNFQSKPAAIRPGRTVSSRRRPEISLSLQGIPAANDFRRKVEFIKNVVKEWVSNGGLGNSSMSRETRLRWGGYRDTLASMKQTWVTVGARWGDERHQE
ncbi:serine/threonine protein kinase [Xylaria grammica]|nr:serine/threonine protein kinase [Xylaria grammica]